MDLMKRWQECTYEAWRGRGGGVSGIRGRHRRQPRSQGQGQRITLPDSALTQRNPGTAHGLFHIQTHSCSSPPSGPQEPEPASGLTCLLCLKWWSNLPPLWQGEKQPHSGSYLHQKGTRTAPPPHCRPAEQTPTYDLDLELCVCFGDFHNTLAGRCRGLVSRRTPTPAPPICSSLEDREVARWSQSRVLVLG